MLTHRGFSAWISVKESPLPEYLVAVDGLAVSCWIPSKPGERFTVYWQDHGSKVDSATFIHLDGVVVPGRFLYGSGLNCRGGVRVSEDTERPFMFQDVPETTSTSTPVPADNLKGPGMITVRIKQVDRGEAKEVHSNPKFPDSPVGRRVGDMAVGLGPPVPSPRLDYTWSSKPHAATQPSRSSTYVTFVFRYRSPEFLINQGIMPLPSVKKEESATLVLSDPKPPPIPRFMSDWIAALPLGEAALASKAAESAATCMVESHEQKRVTSQATTCPPTPRPTPGPSSSPPFSSPTSNSSPTSSLKRKRSIEPLMAMPAPTKPFLRLGRIPSASRTSSFSVRSASSQSFSLITGKAGQGILSPTGDDDLDALDLPGSSPD